MYTSLLIYAIKIYDNMLYMLHVCKILIILKNNNNVWIPSNMENFVVAVTNEI